MGVHHKRGRPKNARAGCLLCKPWKANGAKATTLLSEQEKRAAEDAAQQITREDEYEGLAEALLREDQQDQDEEDDRDPFEELHVGPEGRLRGSAAAYQERP